MKKDNRKLILIAVKLSSDQLLFIKKYANDHCEGNISMATRKAIDTLKRSSK